MFKVISLILLSLSPTLNIFPAGAPYNDATADQLGWNNMPPRSANMFNDTWDTKGYKQMYNLNSMAPFGSDRNTGFDSMVPFSTPHGASRYSYYPTQTNFLSNGENGAFSYDINEPRYQELYKQYYRFFNKNLARAHSQLNFADNIVDLNNDHMRKKLNPKSFRYGGYFDGFNEQETLPGPNLNYFPHKTEKVTNPIFRRGSRSLLQTSPSNKIHNDHNNGILQNDNKTTQEIIHKLEKRVESMRELISEIKNQPLNQKKTPPRKLKYIAVSPEVLSRVDLKPYIFDSLSPHSLKPRY